MYLYNHSTWFHTHISHGFADKSQFCGLVDWTTQLTGVPAVRRYRLGRCNGNETQIWLTCHPRSPLCDIFTPFKRYRSPETIFFKFFYYKHLSCGALPDNKVQSVLYFSELTWRNTQRWMWKMTLSRTTNIFPRMRLSPHLSCHRDNANTRCDALLGVRVRTFACDTVIRDAVRK